jgi:DNA-binding response OmpR family regulator
VLSGDDLETIEPECVRAGADDVIVKPISPAELRRRLVAAAPAGKKLPVAS